MNYTMIAVNETYTVNVSDIEATATMASSMVNYSVPVSASPLLPSHCYRVCRCNDSVGYAATTMWYNMTANETRRANMMSVNMTANGTRIVNMTTMSVKMTSAYLSMSSDVSMSPTPSGINMLYTPSANVTRMSHNSSVWPTPSSAIHPPFVCPNESCWEEVECMSHSLRISSTRYHDTASISPTLSTVASSSAVPTECPFPVDCHGDCGGDAFRDCDVCIEGNTGVNSLRDCGGECNGTAFNSSCGICLGEGSSDPFLDCNDECYGEKHCLILAVNARVAEQERKGIT
ncbi:hypothetical protein OS493_031334 [Desmophyllum pertusum]|uniref:Uncharacterized protein n=1 Tax=Desmophyllum pertusum TaxID=174260 RepID=A0A9W9YYY3_9CNID|nr:hypothetical protein OS493_031334 [Desmophyllum pertusum]